MSEKYITLEELCGLLSITRATGRNWLRLGKIESQKQIDGREYFSGEYALYIKNALASGEVDALRSRRNKKYVSGKAFYDKYVSDNCECRETVFELAGVLKESAEPVTDTAMRVILADCALKMLMSVDDPENMERLQDRYEEILSIYIENNMDIGCWKRLIDDIIGDKDKARIWIRENKDLLRMHYDYQPGEDVLGLLYMSIRDIGSRKAAGSYYTPTEVVKQMVSGIVKNLYNTINTIERNDSDHIRVLDPCCGTGNFLIQLSKMIPMGQIYACDIDELSVQLARFNLALTHSFQCENKKTISKTSLNIEDLNRIYDNITCRNFLIKDDSADIYFDVIVGNPPWGYVFDCDMRDYLRKKYRTAGKRGIESYDVFVERSLELLVDGGVLELVLPEAILDVRNHRDVRQVIAENSDIEGVRFVGDVFHGVQCPAITLRLVKSTAPGHIVGAEIKRNGQKFVICNDRPLSPDGFQVRLSDEEYEMLLRLENTGDCTFLRGQADFALGIVTGDNKKYISMELQNGMEPVVTGADVYRYGYDKCDKYILSGFDRYQQAAPEKMYRASEKLLYRFINRQLVFAYDDRQMVTLNSCNVVIPHIQGLKMKYVMAVLNSRIAQYMYEKRYNSVKVLRSHIESIPIPLADEEIQARLIHMVDQLIECPRDNAEGKCKLYDEIDDIVRRLYSVTDDEYKFIKNALSGYKYML